jgi:hypothetical protein
LVLGVLLFVYGRKTKWDSPTCNVSELFQYLTRRLRMPMHVNGIDVEHVDISKTVLIDVQQLFEAWGSRREGLVELAGHGFDVRRQWNEVTDDTANGGKRKRNKQQP